jgi:hypothetical protein
MLPYTSYLEIDTEDTYVIPLYSVPLIHLKLNDWEEKKEVLMKRYETISSNPDHFKQEGEGKYSVHTDFHKTYDDKDFSTTELIYQYFDRELEFISEIFSCPVELNNSWFERSTRNKQHTPHNHGNSGLSCVVFLKFDPKYHCPTVFIDPNLASDSPVAPLNEMPSGIREGSMIVFPSYLYHYTLPNESDVDRIILSFNMALQKEHLPMFGGQSTNSGKEKEYAISSSDA